MKRSQAGLLVIAVAVLGLLAYWFVNQGPSTPNTSSTPRATASATKAGSKGSKGGATKSASAANPKGGSATDPESGLPWIEESALPAEAKQTLKLIDAGGPYPYDKDGTTFGNFEGILPKKQRGYYREYTVPTPGSRDRGARRIVTGDKDKQFFWTDDHYASFARIRR